MIYRRLLPALILAALIAALAACSSTAPRPSASPIPEPVTAAIGDELEGEGWAVSVTGLTFDATAAVAAANEFNPTPDEGQQYALLDVTVERTGEASTALDIGLTLVLGDDTIDPAPAVAPTPLHLLAEFTPQTPVTGQVVFAVPEGTDEANVRVALSPSQSFLIPVG